jgi:DNA-binding MarR family transcriptional regulator
MPTVEEVSRTDAGLASSLRVSVARLHRRLRTEQAEASPALSPACVGVMALLYREGDHTVGQLAQAERVQPPSMTRTVGCLEADGLVERRPHPTDGRQVVITLAEHGREVLLADRARRDAWLARRLTELPADELELLRRAAPILERLSNTP